MSMWKKAVKSFLKLWVSQGNNVPVNSLKKCSLLLIVPNVERFCSAGADIVTFHVESDTAENTALALRTVHESGKRAGVVVKPGTAAEAVLPFLADCDIILVMTVEPGFGGQAFMREQLPKICTIRQWIDERNPACELEVDGGVDAVTARDCVAAGANVLVAGSAIYRSTDIPATICALRGV